MVSRRGFVLVTGSILLVSAALASPARAASPADPEPACYEDGICLEFRVQTGAGNGEGKEIAVMQNGGSLGTAILSCPDGTAWLPSLAGNDITRKEAERRIEEKAGHFCGVP